MVNNGENIDGQPILAELDSKRTVKEQTLSLNRYAASLETV